MVWQFYHSRRNGKSWKTYTNKKGTDKKRIEQSIFGFFVGLCHTFWLWVIFLVHVEDQHIFRKLTSQKCYQFFGTYFWPGFWPRLRSNFLGQEMRCTVLSGRRKKQQKHEAHRKQRRIEHISLPELFFTWCTFDFLSEQRVNFDQGLDFLSFTR